MVYRDVGERHPRRPRRGAPGRSRVWNITSDSWLRCPRDHASAASTPWWSMFLWWSMFSLVEYVCLEALSGGVCQAQRRSGGVCQALVGYVTPHNLRVKALLKVVGVLEAHNLKATGVLKVLKALSPPSPPTP